MGTKQLILFYNMMFDMPLTYVKADIPEGFELTTDRRLMQEAVAVVFHLPSLYSPYYNYFSRYIPSLYSIASHCKRLMKKRGQIWVAWFMESEVNYPHFSDPSFMKPFDLTMSYHPDADIFKPYFFYSIKDLLRGSVQEKAEGKNVCAFISSSYHKSGRLEYLKTLMKYLDIHSYGKVLQNKNLEKDTGRPSKMDTIAKYKFTVAFENAIARDYVTEKFYEPLIAGSVPIYLGAPNINEFAPGDKCLINAQDWDSPKSLAQYVLAVANDEALYQSYFKWRSEPFKPNFIRLMEQQKEDQFVRLCKKIQEIR